MTTRTELRKRHSAILEAGDRLHRASWRDLALRSARAADRDRRGGSTTPDGYPSSHGGTGGGGGRAAITVDGERVPVTGVEAAMFAAGGRQPRDRLHEDVEHLKAAWRRLDDALGAVEAALDRIDARDDDRPLVGRWCEWHSVAGHQVEAEHYGRVGDRLPSEVDLCGACYGFVWRQPHGGVIERPEVQASGALVRRVRDSRKAAEVDVAGYRSGADMGCPTCGGGGHSASDCPMTLSEARQRHAG